MKVEIRYACTYAYADSVSFSPHLFRLIPKVDRYLKVRQFEFATNQDAVINWRRDLFDNEVASCFYPNAGKDLTVNLQIDIDVDEKNAFGFLLDTRALHLPFVYDEAEFRILAPYLQTNGSTPLPFWQAPRQPVPTLETLIALNEAIHRNIRYERREEGDARSSAETIALGSGSCRDIAMLLVDSLRGMALAARHASGYLCEFGDGEKRAEGALHAWVDVFLPGAGWVGMDPTNGTFCDHHHLTAAVGLTTADISPVVGTYYANSPVPHEMNAQLQIIPHVEP